MKLNYKIYGSGTPIIILHGLFGMLDNWQSFAKMLTEKGYMPILVDQRDHGKSPHTTDFNYKLLAEDLKHFMEDQHIYKSHILGHSMGGKAALQFAHDFPDMVDKLIIVDIGVKAYVGGHEEILNALNGIDLKTVKSRNEVFAYFENYRFDPSVSLFLMKNLTRNKEGKYSWKMNLDLLTLKYHNILSEVNLDYRYEKDVLFARGENSQYIIDQDWCEILNYFPNAILKTIPNAGHWVHAQNPDELFNEINTFLLN